MAALHHLRLIPAVQLKSTYPSLHLLPQYLKPLCLKAPLPHIPVCAAHQFLE
jgi:hypothetical protein